ncbi:MULTISPECIES: acetate--CoA ligase family protein [unclassified Lentimicrobium]|uniref:acetate--CoA ligase family protein n=1 Tax=unclassified Lentimicrobium TaxID=2677434 RepID=UPI001556ACE1|nr:MULTISPECIES: acetate--CoA ligase [unclassified Lentimicrobium]NPD46828.1 CoA-binding protein [Lentimicrobium sp. S6]NPD86492.1 CoA-binding protein [Lentimicrobium sp. L6]
MIVQQLVNPSSIVVIGGSNDIHKPGGKILKNLVDGNYQGNLYVSNPKEDEIQGIKSYRDLKELPNVDLAIIAIAAKYSLPTIEFLTENKNTKAFIIISAGFSEESEEGAILEQKIVDQINKHGGSLIGPNCTGILTTQHHSIFTEPIPKLDPQGCDFISGSGATACFIMEAGIDKGLSFSSVYAVGNSAQIGVEEVLEYLDETFDSETSSKVKLLYIENVDKPDKLLKHAKSLIEKGCKIAAVKAGSSDAGSRAASSHTGALASPDFAVDALFKKAGIVRCYGREELITVASVFMHPELQGKNIAIITHAGGPAVMLTDALSKGGLEVPHIEGEAAEELKGLLYPGSSVANPIDFLATGTAEQLGHIIDYVDQKFDDIDGMVVIFGTPGLAPIFDVYELLDEKMKTAKKPIFPVLPSTYTAHEEVKSFVAKGRINFPDEVLFGNALTKVFATEKPIAKRKKSNFEIDKAYIRAIIDSNENGYLLPSAVRSLLDGAGIPRAKEATVYSKEGAVESAAKIGYPMVMKVVGPVHKSDVGGVVLNVKSDEQLVKEFNRMMKIPETKGILLQPMLSGTELFVGANYEDKFGHMILCGLGGIFIEVLKDVKQGLCPICPNEALGMIRGLKSYKIIEGVRGQKGIDEKIFADILVRLSALLEVAPEIKELDLNPLLATGKKIIAVDARIRIEK